VLPPEAVNAALNNLFWESQKWTKGPFFNSTAEVDLQLSFSGNLKRAENDPFFYSATDADSLGISGGIPTLLSALSPPKTAQLWHLILFLRILLP